MHHCLSRTGTDNDFTDKENDGRAVYAGYANGDVKAFDLRRLGVAWRTSVASGVCSIDAAGGALCCSTTAGQVHTLRLKEASGVTLLDDAISGEQQCHGGKTVWSCQFLPNDAKTLMTTGSDGLLELHSL